VKWRVAASKRFNGECLRGPFVRHFLYPTRFRDLAPLPSIGLLAIVHAVGAVGFLIEPRLFASLVPLHLLFCFGVWATTVPRGSSETWWLLLICGSTGFLAEVVGVHTSLLFGSYEYGNTLGPKLASVPLLLLLNWSLLTALAADISGELGDRRRWNVFVKSALGTCLLVILDVLLEPFAMRYDLWNWQNDVVPLHNYFGWTAVSFTLQLAMHATQRRPRSAVSKWLYCLLLAFFAIAWLVGDVT
jgi:putative membrane protein